MSLNKLQLNSDKTEVMLACPKKFLNHPSLPASLTVNELPISFSPSVRSLGVTLDPTLSFQKHISNICKSAYLELRKISSVRHYLTTDATKTLVCSLVLSKIDYCNSLLAGLPKYLLDRLQRIQNNAARLVFKSSKYEHATPLLHSLHWLPITKRIEYKLSSLSFAVVSGSAPEYFSELLNLYTPSRQLRSAADTRLFRLPTVQTKTCGERSFAYQAPVTWNRLPLPLRHTDSLTTFKTNLKTHLFQRK
ncbi:hypothetical protein V1264_002486 [Littorina saxatilis]